FTRPYPYHLDYYRMKYGGSYAPYFGNLYGPPQVYAPSYWGNFGNGGYDTGGVGPQTSFGQPQPNIGSGGMPGPGHWVWVPDGEQPGAPVEQGANGSETIPPSGPAFGQ